MLSALTVKTAQAKAKPYKLADSGGLYLLVVPTGGKRWRWDYRYSGKRKTLALGTWPAVSLSDARRARDKAKVHLGDGEDPGAARRAAKRAQVETFAAAAERWVAVQTDWSDRHRKAIESRITRRLLPKLGARPVAEIDPPELLRVLEIVAEESPYLAGRIRQIAEAIFAYAIATGIGGTTINPATQLRGTLKKPPQVRHRSAIIEPGSFRVLYRTLTGYQGDPITRAALMLLPLVFTRPGELRHLEWSEVAGDTWIIPAHKTKMRSSDLVVPLAPQVRAILDDLRQHTGHGRYAFSSLRTLNDCRRPISENTLGAALLRLGYDKQEVTPHGFRASARTLLVETLGYRAELVELQLGHLVRDPLGRAYNRTQFLPERRAMMEAWATWTTT